MRGPFRMQTVRGHEKVRGFQRWSQHFCCDSLTASVLSTPRAPLVGRPAAVAFALVDRIGLRTVRARPSGVKGCCASLRDGRAAAFDPGASAVPAGSGYGQAQGLPVGRAATVPAAAVSWAA